MKIEMSTKQATLVHVDEDYIDMELTSSSNFFTYSIDSPPKTTTRDFEFQMNSFSNEKEYSKTTPADDLFYKGKLLPLHLPPRLQMVKKLLENTNLEESTFLFTPPSFTNYTPLESCNISTSESCRVSSEVNPDEYSFEINDFVVSDSPKIKSWPKKLKQMNQLLFGSKLKSSKAYLKSLFNKSGCSEKSFGSDDANNKVGIGMKKKDKDKDKNKSKNKNPFEIISKRENFEDDLVNHRRSFSGVVQRQHCVNKVSSLSTSSSGSSSNSSSFSFSSAGYYDLRLFKRSTSANYELEGSVEEAIAHCKQSQSQQQCCSKNVTDDDDDGKICSQFSTKITVCEDDEESTETETLSSNIV